MRTIIIAWLFLSSFGSWAAYQDPVEKIFGDLEDSNNHTKQIVLRDIKEALDRETNNEKNAHKHR